MRQEVPHEALAVLEEIVQKIESCHKNNDHILHLTKELSKLAVESCQPSNERASEKSSGCKEDSLRSENETENVKFHGDLEQMENILQEKLQENGRLKSLNERLMLNSSQKSQKIKELTHTVSLYNERQMKTKEISIYKDKIGKYNVHIQKLKKQLSVETKKLQNEKAKVLRLQKNRRSLETTNQGSTLETGNGPNNPRKKLKKNDRKEPLRISIEELDHLYIQKSLTIIKQNEGSSINEETLDEPENLDSDLDEKSVSEIHEQTDDEESKGTQSINSGETANGV